MEKLLTLALALGPLVVSAQTDDPLAEALAASASGAPESPSAPPVATVDEQTYPHSLSAKVLMVDYGVAPRGESSVTNGIDVAYLRRFTKAVSLVVPAKVGVLNEPENPATKRPFVSTDLTLQLGHSFFDDRVRPYATVGGGVVVESSNGANVQAPLGGGIRVRLTEAAYITGQYEYRKSFTEGRDNTQVGMGLLFNLGRGKFNPEYWDSDGDGVMDHEDECSEIRGPRRLKGCPDSDGDGINDAADPCPLHAASRAMGGCPDGDGDGVGDPHDACPGVAGLPELDGCPLPDKDGDGVGDDVDACPEAPGTLNGCPDTDADGIVDRDDDCPKQSGPKATGGCPDRDSDGVPDVRDNCPLLPGALNGCPDRDDDGVDDASDRCPNIAGAAEHDGCPEIMRSQRELFEYAVRAIAFADRSTNVTVAGFETLTGLADLLEEYPDYKLRVTGHADFAEAVPNRDAFSKQRAQACAEYIASRGIEANRIIVDGVGAGRPIKRTGTSEERAINRRVEFDLFVQE